MGRRSGLPALRPDGCHRISHRLSVRPALAGLGMTGSFTPRSSYALCQCAFVAIKVRTGCEEGVGLVWYGAERCGLLATNPVSTTRYARKGDDPIPVWITRGEALQNLSRIRMLTLDNQFVLG